MLISLITFQGHLITSPIVSNHPEHLGIKCHSRSDGVLGCTTPEVPPRGIPVVKWHLPALIWPSPPACASLARHFHWLNIKHTSQPCPPLIRLHPICSRRSIPVLEPPPALLWEQVSDPSADRHHRDTISRHGGKRTWPPSAVSNNGQHESLPSTVSKSWWCWSALLPCEEKKNKNGYDEHVMGEIAWEFCRLCDNFALFWWREKGSQ